MELTTTPAWLNKDFFVYALTGSSDRSDCEIITLETVPGLFGDNYASQVFKSRIKYKVNRNSDTKKYKLFFIKAPVQKGPLVDMVREELWAEKELQMYKEYFPLMDRLVGGIDTIPKYFPCKEIRTVVLQDLAGEGYIMCDKFKQLDFEHSASVLKSLARFHAASVAVHKHNPDFVETLGTKIFKDATDSVIKDKYRNFRKIVQSWKGFERFSDLCGQYEGKYKKMTDLLNPVFARRKTLNVLIHGDAWMNNVMFKYDEAGKIEKVKLIDFQLPAYGSIGIDMQYFTWTSIQPSVRAHRLSELYCLYLETLNLYLEKYCCEERLNQEQFEEEIEFSLDLVYCSLVCCHYVMLSGKYSNQDIVGEDGKILSAYDDACYRTNAEQGLLFLEKKGFFSRTRKNVFL